jgi:hypothetical protein
MLQTNFWRSPALWLRATFSKFSARHPLTVRVQQLRRQQGMARLRLPLGLILFLLLAPALFSLFQSLLR